MHIRDILCALCGRLVPFVPSPCDGVSDLLDWFDAPILLDEDFKYVL